jgi:hypothetical protein
METVRTILDWAGYPSTVLVIAVALWRLFLWLRGISPALRGLGNGLAKRKVALFARNADLAGLRQTLMRSNLFRESNLIDIQRPEDIGNAEDASVFVVNWPDWSEHIKTILDRKKDKVPLIVYCPRSAGQIPNDVMVQIDGHRNTAISNFRGRLLNDIVTAMITTSYDK